MKFLNKAKILIFIFILGSFFSNKAISQIVKPITWEFISSNSNPKVGETVVLNFKGKIKKGWHLFSNNFKIDKGPNTFVINFNKSTDYQLIGEPKAKGDLEKIDEYFKVKVRYFSKNCHFEQKVKILKKGAKISGDYDGQVCTDNDGVCSQNIGQFSFQMN